MPPENSPPFWQRIVRLVRQVSLMIFLTLLLLELVAQVVWWNRSVVTVFERPLQLLPLPLVSQKHIQILTSWPDNPDRYVQFDPVLGWSIRPNARAEHDGAIYTANSVGMRSLREYPVARVPGLVRMATFGPSFTHGDEVSDQATWQAQLERARADLEVMNWGVGGYGTDQAFLRYKIQGVAYQPDIVIIGFEENNVRRNVNRFRPFYHRPTGIPLTKPVFVADESGALVLLENPFADFQALRDTLLNDPNGFLDVVCPHDYYCDRARYQPMALDVFKSFRFLRTLAYEVRHVNAQELSASRDQAVERVNWLLIQMFVEEVMRNGSVPIVLLFPERTSLEAHEKGQWTFYRAGVTFLQEQGIQVIDLGPAFVEAKKTQNLNYRDYYVADGGHFNALGNQIVSQTVLAHLCRQGILPNCS